MTELQPILAAYLKTTGRQCNYMVHEYALFAYHQAGYTAEDMTLVCQFLVRENRRNSYQYSLHLTKLIGDLARFDDILNDARAKERNRPKPPTPKEQVLAQFRPAIEQTLTGTTALTVKEVLRRIVT